MKIPKVEENEVGGVMWGENASLLKYATWAIVKSASEADDVIESTVKREMHTILTWPLS